MPSGEQRLEQGLITLETSLLGEENRPGVHFLFYLKLFFSIYHFSFYFLFFF